MCLFGYNDSYELMIALRVVCFVTVFQHWQFFVKLFEADFIEDPNNQNGTVRTMRELLLSFATVNTYGHNGAIYALAFVLERKCYIYSTYSNRLDSYIKNKIENKSAKTHRYKITRTRNLYRWNTKVKYLTLIKYQNSVNVIKVSVKKDYSTENLDATEAPNAARLHYQIFHCKIRTRFLWNSINQN